MAKKKKQYNLAPFVKFVVPIVLIVALICGVYQGVYSFLTKSKLFTIQTVMIDPSLHFIEEKDFRRLKGKNIFTVNLKELQKKIAFKYPRVTQLRIVRHFPSQISIDAKQRAPFAQALIKGKMLTFDKEGIILSLINKRNSKLPYVNGIPSSRQKLNLGFSLSGKEIRTALRIIKAFHENSTLSSYAIESIQINNFSQIEVMLSNHLKIYFDQYQIKRKTKELAFMLSRERMNPDETNYIDLRFKEPIIGKKN